MGFELAKPIGDDDEALRIGVGHHAKMRRRGPTRESGRSPPIAAASRLRTLRRHPLGSEMTAGAERVRLIGTQGMGTMEEIAPRKPSGSTISWLCTANG